MCENKNFKDSDKYYIDILLIEYTTISFMIIPTIFFMILGYQSYY